jgi:hypothetical protein
MLDAAAQEATQRRCGVLHVPWGRALPDHDEQAPRTTEVDRESAGCTSLRNVLAQVPKGSAEMVAAAVPTIFAQPKAEIVRDQLGVIAGMLGRQLQVLSSTRDQAAW